MDEEERARGDLGDRPCDAHRACSHPGCATRTASPGSRNGRALDRGQRARRARQRSRARLPDVGERRRLLRLAVQLLRPARRRAVKPQRPELVAQGHRARLRAGPHTRGAGPGFYDGSLLPAAIATACSSASTARGIASRDWLPVVFVPFSRPAGGPLEDVLNGFLDEDGKAQGRPVGVAVDRSGALLVADDVGNIVWRVTPRRLPTGRDQARRRVPIRRVRLGAAERRPAARPDGREDFASARLRLSSAVRSMISRCGVRALARALRERVGLALLRLFLDSVQQIVPIAVLVLLRIPGVGHIGDELERELELFPGHPDLAQGARRRASMASTGRISSA